MASIQANPPATVPETPGPAPVAPRLWGLCAVRVHDRIWAARGVCVVRPASQDPVPQRGPGLYLLLHRADMLDFSIAAASEELFATRADALHLRVLGPRPRRHDEVVRTSDAGEFLGLERVYNRGPVRTGSCWVTSSPAIARLWASLPPRRTSRLLKASSLCRNPATLTLSGAILDVRDEAALAEWACRAAESRGRMGGVVPGAYRYDAGVWAHETATIGQDVRFAGPALVGAGVVIPDGATVIGPVVLPDRATVADPPAVDWAVVNTPAWRAADSLRPGSVYAFTKRLFDVLFSLAVLAVLAPLAPIIMLLIYIEDGRPFFFAHTRQTRGGREFPCYKFRTMINNAEDLKRQLVAANVSDGAHFYIKDDPRLLKVGRWLRRFQIDELPQFINVLLGHMSVVGPRPSPDRENQFCPAWRDARLSVRPGITGLWQVRRTRAPDTDFQEWIRYDLEYVQRRSWRLDLWIILLTIRRVLNG